MSKPLLVFAVFIVGLCVVVKGAMRVWGSSKEPAKVAQATPAPSPTPAGFFGAFNKAAEPKNTPAPKPFPSPPPGPAYEISREFVRASFADHYLRTDRGQYELGRMSVHGFVEQISGRVVKILTPSGRLLYVVCDDEAPRSLGVPSPSPAPTPAPSAEPPAPLEEGLDYMQRRLVNDQERASALDRGQYLVEVRNGKIAPKGAEKIPAVAVPTPAPRFRNTLLGARSSPDVSNTKSVP